MSKEEIEQNFTFEKEKHFEFFLPFYQQQNWQVVNDNINSGQKNDWDVRLEIMAGQYVLVDEKALRKEFNNFLLEIMQDIRTGGLGWFYSKKDWILYASWNEDKYPSSLYLVKTKELKEYVATLDGMIETCISLKGWGSTWNIALPWDELMTKNIAEKLI